MTTVRLPENVAKLLSSSNIEAGFFSKKPLTNRDVVYLLAHYDIKFKKLFRKYNNKINDFNLLYDYTINITKEVEKEKLGNKPGFIQRWKNKQAAIDNLADDAEKLLEKYQGKILGKIMSKISSDVFDRNSSYSKIEYNKTPNTELLKKDLESLKLKYEDAVGLKELYLIVDETLWDGRDELEN